MKKTAAALAILVVIALWILYSSVRGGENAPSDTTVFTALAILFAVFFIIMHDYSHRRVKEPLPPPPPPS